jgi:hypothetical protein
MLDEPALYRLLDNRWLITILKQVDGQYLAFARNPGQPPREVLPQVGLDPDDKTKLVNTSEGIPRQHAVAATVTEAVAKLADSVFGLETTAETTEA